MPVPEFERATACCFTGHRPDKLPGGYGKGVPTALAAALEAAVKAAIRDGYTTFLCGMAQGVDTLAAEIVLRRRQAGEPLRLIAALPCPDQDARWPEAARRRYRALLAQTDGQYTACDSYTPYCMNGRNLWMVEHASRLIAVFDGSPGGTAHTVRLAEEHGLTLVRIDPHDYT